MSSISPQVRVRRRHNELKDAVRSFLESRGNEPASIAEIVAGTVGLLGTAPASSYRSALQDERLFVRVSRGVFQLQDR
jgi:hypothetical protein